MANATQTQVEPVVQSVELTHGGKALTIILPIQTNTTRRSGVKADGKTYVWGRLSPTQKVIDGNVVNISAMAFMYA